MGDWYRVCGRCAAPIERGRPSNERYGGTTTGCASCVEAYTDSDIGLLYQGLRVLV